MASGFDDSQAISSAQMLRLQGIGVQIIALNSSEAVTGMRGAVIKPDICIADVDTDTLDAVIIPGGNSTAILKLFDKVLTLLLKMQSEGKPIGAIANGAAVLAAAGLVRDRRITGDPAIRGNLEESGARYLDQGLVVDHNIVTSQSEDSLHHLIDTITFLLEPAASRS